MKVYVVCLYFLASKNEESVSFVNGGVFSSIEKMREIFGNEWNYTHYKDAHGNCVGSIWNTDYAVEGSVFEIDIDSEYCIGGFNRDLLNSIPARERRTNLRLVE